jgi:hypothetical protein
MKLLLKRYRKLFNIDTLSIYQIIHYLNNYDIDRKVGRI